MTSLDSLNELDSNHWTSNENSPRFIDLLSDYAHGSQLFVVDADSLLQYTLQTDLLHSIWALESTLNELYSRDANFTVVSFHDNQHLTTQTTSSHHTLFRSILMKELNSLLLSKGKDGDASGMLYFQNMRDPDWLTYYELKRPMFILTNDGGLVSPSSQDQENDAARILVQRHFLFENMKSGIAVVLLQSADFKDGKIITYIYDQPRNIRKNPLPAHLDEAAQQALMSLNAISAQRDQHLLSTVPIPTPASSKFDDILTNAANVFLSLPVLSAIDRALLYVYLAHVPFVRSLSLATRAQPLRSVSSALSSHLSTSFLPKLQTALSKSVEMLDISTGSNGDYDIDERLFTLLLIELAVSSSPSLESLLGPTVHAEAERLWSTLSSRPASLDLSIISAHFPHDPSALAPIPVPTAESNYTLLPFSNPSFDPHFSLVNVATSSSTSAKAMMPNRLPSSTVFSDATPWHYAKPLLLTHLGSPPPPKVPLLGWQIRKKARQEGKFMAQMQKNASSLTGATGGTLKQTAIPVVGNRAKVKPASTPSSGGAHQSGPGKKGGKEVVKVLNSREKLLAANAAKALVEDAAVNTTWWLSKLASLAPLPLPAQIALITGYFSNKRFNDPWLGTEIMLKRLDLELRLWIADEKRETPRMRDQVVTYLARTVVGLLKRSRDGTGEVRINERQGKALMSILEVVGLSSLAPKDIVFGAAALAVSNGANTTSGKKGKDKEKESKDKKKEKESSNKKDKKEKDDKEDKEEKVKLTFSFVSLIKSGKIVHEWMKITEDPVEFQLRCMGEYMIRSLDSQPDSRVNFEPDAWQIDVLNKIDADESMLIVAPTSSGKTFISFAAMEKVLRESDDGIVIYIAPTKALVNQVAAEVFARFRKDVPGRQMWAIHTLDYRIGNPQNCQILVTVPHILSTMLLNPALAAAWTPRIRRIILDEIHSISMEEGGAIWEQVLLMNPAPLIGLSATVGAPERFSGWLESIEKTRGRKYSLIQHHHRYNALRKSAYAPSLPFKRLGPLNEHKYDPAAFPHVHPIAALALGDSHLPEDLALEPADCLSLVKAMREVDEANLEPELIPTTYFARTTEAAIKIADVLQYERELKATLLRWMKEDEGVDSPYRRVIQKLEGPLREALAGPERAIEEGSSDLFFSLFTPMLADLNAANQLPAIIFNFDRRSCERIASTILSDLETGEAAWRAKSPAYKAKVAKALEEEKLAKTRAKAAEAAARQKKDEDNDGGREEKDDGPIPFDPEAPSDEFSFVGRGISQVEFDREIQSLSWMTDLPPYLIPCLRRGVGLHHSGLARRYRVLVENFFRRGILKVVISTETLALGVNAPAKTVVFAGDNHLLTPLNFRQCAGRAGRRGFDTLGRVVFCAISLDRIQRLLLSRLPKLGGTFPLTPTLVLRLNSLLHGSQRAPLAVRSIEQLMSLPQLSVGSSADQDQSRHFLRFSLEYLRRAGLIDETGRPCTLFGLAQALYHSEPSNFALVALIRSGELHKITDTFDTDPIGTLQRLIHVLAHLFARQNRPAQSAASLKRIPHNSPSTVILPPLPPAIKKVLEVHHAAIVRIFSTFATEFAQQHASSLGPDDQLPLSGRKIVPFPESIEAGTLASKLEQTAIPVDSRSPFVALSGRGDVYDSVEELVSTTRKGIVLTKHAIPSLPFLESRDHFLDAYVIDFFRHGRQDLLFKDNGIKKSDVWFFLGDFSTALGAIQTSLEVILERSTEDREEDNDSDDGRDAGEDEKLDDEIKRPVGVNDSDFKLYRAVAALRREFNARYKLIFA